MSDERLLLRVTMVDLRPSRPDRTLPVEELLVDAEVGTTAAELASAVGARLSWPGCCPGDLFVDGSALDSQVLGLPPLLDGICLSVGAPGVGPERSGAGVLEAHVVSGPDAGQMFRLSPGRHLLGRAAECDLRVEDPDVSRVHATLQVGSTQVLVDDTGSTNGLLLDEEPLRGATSMTTSSSLRVGSSTLRLRIPSGSPASVRPDGFGHLLVNRRPRVNIVPVPVTVTFPAPPAPVSRSRLPLLGMVVPLLLSLTLAAVMRSPTMLLFGLMSPVLMLTTWVGERRGGRGRRRAAEADHREADEAARAELEVELDRERAAREHRQPDLATVLAVAEGRQSRVWERRPDDEDFMVTRLGIGLVPARTLVAGEGAPGTVPELPDVPVTLRLREAQVLGVAGPRRRCLAVARSLVAQLAVWHSPLDLRLVVLGAGPALEPDWEWATLLPHARAGSGASVGFLDGGDQVGGTAAGPVAALVELMEQRWAAATTAYRARPDVVVLLDGAARLRSTRGVAQILERGPAVGVTVIALDTAPEMLPVEVRCLVDLDAEGSCLVHGPDAPNPVRVAVDEPRGRWAVRLARAIAPLRDATPTPTGRSVPRSVRLLDLVGADLLRGDGLAAAWATRPRSTELPIGVGDGAVVTLDLERDGPHALVAGTTGAGKSELLQSVIAALALGNRPDELGFILVDYKGGSAFRSCADLPHTLGVVTDLDGQLTERALVSMSAELRRRERLFASVGATDLSEYQATRPTVAVPRLVIVIDEFRLLAEELPDFVQGLVRIAAVGRSLGVHLILATQRPAGIVSADIRANVGLRIALRVRDRMDSTDVVESPDAAGIRESTPGRAFVRSASTELTEFQTARVTGTSLPRDRVVVTRWALDRDGVPASRGRAGTRDTSSAAVGGAAVASDLARIVAAARQATSLHGIPPVAAPWLPPLPDRLPLDSLDLDVGPAPDGHLPFGLRDAPARQTQLPHVWDLADGGHLGLAGGGRSGRTTALRTIAGALASRWGPDRVHLYAVHAGELSALAALPHTAALAHRDDVEHVDQIVRALLELVRERQERRAAPGHTGVEDQPGADAEPGTAPAWLVLLIDGWEALAESVSGVDYGRPVQDLFRLMRDGAAVGLRVAVTGERALLAGQLASLVSTRLALRFADPLQLALAGIPARAVPTAQPPGRALDLTDHLETQVAFLGADPSAAAQAAALEDIGRAAARQADPLDPQARPRPVHPLPRQVMLGDIAAGPRTGQERRHLVVGVGAGDLSALGFDLGSGHRRIAVVGPPRSGRTTALVTMVHSLVASGRPVVVVTSGARGADLLPRSARVISPDGRDDLVALRRRHPDLAVVVDDAEQVSGTPVEPVLQEVSRLVDEDDGVVALATLPSALAGHVLAATVASRRCGVLLCPDPANGDLLGVRVSRLGPRHPGRGLLVVEGRTRPIQVARFGAPLSVAPAERPDHAGGDSTG